MDKRKVERALSAIESASNLLDFESGAKGEEREVVDEALAQLNRAWRTVAEGLPHDDYIP